MKQPSASIIKDPLNCDHDHRSSSIDNDCDCDCDQQVRGIR